MSLAADLLPEAILIGLRPSAKDDLFQHLARAVSVHPALRAIGFDAEKVYQAITERERLGNTGIGDGFAFPHARLAELDTIVIGLALLSEALDYGSFDHRPVTVACLVLAPEKKPTLALKAVAQIARVFAKPEAAAALRRATDGDQVLAILCREEGAAAGGLTARDVMRKPAWVVEPDLPVSEVTQLMVSRNLNSVPVVDGAGRILGEISGETLFRFGLPEYCNRTQNVGFGYDSDPFEKYFTTEDRMTARDVMTDRFCRLPAGATLLEVLFALSVQKFPCVYVVDEKDSLLGCIDDGQILSRVMTF